MATEPSKIAYGGDMMLFVDSGKPIAFSTNAKLDIKLSSRNISSKDSGYWVEKAAGRLEWSASGDAFYTETLSASTTMDYADLYALMVARAPITMVFAAATGAAPGQSKDATKKNFTGQAIITGLPVNAPDGETSTFSISLEGSGALVMA